MNAGVSTPSPLLSSDRVAAILKPGQRDVLIDLFDRHFVESQEAVE